MCTSNVDSTIPAALRHSGCSCACHRSLEPWAHNLPTAVVRVAATLLRVIETALPRWRCVYSAAIGQKACTCPQYLARRCTAACVASHWLPMCGDAHHRQHSRGTRVSSYMLVVKTALRIPLGVAEAAERRLCHITPSGKPPCPALLAAAVAWAYYDRHTKRQGQVMRRRCQLCTKIFSSHIVPFGHQCSTMSRCKLPTCKKRRMDFVKQLMSPSNHKPLWPCPRTPACLQTPGKQTVDRQPVSLNVS